MGVTPDSLFFRVLHFSITLVANSRTKYSREGSCFNDCSISHCICVFVGFLDVSIPRVVQIVNRFSFRLTGCVLRSVMIVGGMIAL